MKIKPPFTTASRPVGGGHVTSPHTLIAFVPVKANVLLHSAHADLSAPVRVRVSLFIEVNCARLRVRAASNVLVLCWVREDSVVPLGCGGIVCPRAAAELW